MPNLIDDEMTDEDWARYSEEFERKAEEHWEEVHGLRPNTRCHDIPKRERSVRVVVKKPVNQCKHCLNEHRDMDTFDYCPFCGAIMKEEK